MNRHALAVHAALLADRVRPPAPGVTVLIYHRVGGDSGSAVDLGIDEFRAQLAHLAEHHRVITLDDALRRLAGGDDTPAVVITVDDGTADFAEHLVPALVDTNLPATLYAATSFIDTAEPFPWGAPPVSWAALADAVATGLITVESHSHTHPHFSQLDGPSAADELQRASDSIGSALGRAPRHFAYPRAVVPSAAAEIEVRSRHVSAALAGNAVNTARLDPHRLGRTPVRAGEPIEVFAARASGGLRLEGAIRAAIARHR
jgi:hypothetical protein